MEERKIMDNSSWYAPLEQPEEVTDVFAEAGLYTLRDRELLIKENRPKKRKTALIVGVVIGLLIAAIVLSAVIFGDMEEPADADGDFYEDYWDFYEKAAESDITGENNIPRADVNPGLELMLQSTEGRTALSLQELYKACAPSVVAVSTYVDNEPYGWGTGVIMTEDGYILTNTHVLDNADAAEIVLHDGEILEAKLVGTDPISDVSVLKVETKGLPAAEFAHSDTVQIGDAVVAIGNPLSESLRSTMTEGIISGMSREINHNGRTMVLLQTSAALNSGNSGGALFNAYGQVIGITNMKMVGSILSYAEGVGFAIPSATVKEMADAILDQGAVKGRPAIGIMAYELGEATDEHPDGILVDTVNEGTDAQKQGLLPGDIITHIDGVAAESMAAVSAAVGKKSVGDTVTLTVWREGETLTLQVKLVDQLDV